MPDIIATHGDDGRKIEALLAKVSRKGASALYGIAHDLAKRTIKAEAPVPLHESQVVDLSEHFAAANATANALGRAKVRQRVNRLTTFSEGSDWSWFAEGDSLEAMQPRAALNYFRNLSPIKPVSPELFEAEQVGQAFQLAATTDETLRQKIFDIVMDALRSGQRIRERPGEIEDVLAGAGIHHNKGYGANIFRTNTMEAYRHGAWDEYMSPELDDLYPVWQYIGIADGRERQGPSPRPDHHARFDKIFQRSVSFFDVRGHGIENLANCVLPGNFIHARVKNALKAWYSGEAVKLWFSPSSSVTLTVNHPVITVRGISPAGHLKEGQDLWNYLMPTRIDTTQNEQHAPTRIEDVFDSFGVPIAQISASPLDLYGDGKSIKGQIDIVSPYLCGSNGTNTNKAKEIGNVFLKHAANTSVTPSYLSGALRFRHLHPFKFLGLTSASWSYVGLDKGFSYRASINAEKRRHLVFRHAFGDVQLSQFHDINRFSPQFTCFGPGSELDVKLPRKPSSYSLSFHADFIAELLKRFPGKIAFCKLLKVERFHYEGPVYDVETDTGYFLVGGSGSSSIPILNCRCDHTPIYARDWEAMQARGVRLTDPRTLPQSGGHVGGVSMRVAARVAG